MIGPCCATFIDSVQSINFYDYNVQKAFGELEMQKLQALAELIVAVDKLQELVQAKE